MSKLERREEIIKIIKSSELPVSASSLANSLNVSRQVIVGDVALIRASGINISATPTGYILEDGNLISNFGYLGIIACKHLEDKLEEELYAIVDFGGTIIDVTIEHSTYGQISGILDIGSRHDADLFIKKLKDKQSKPLSDLTDGIHIHRIGCKDKETFNMIVEDLEKRGIALT